MKLGKVGLKVAMSTGPGQLVMGFLSLIHWVLGWFVMSVVVFVRKDFGERYLSWVNIMFGAVAVGLFCGLGNMFISWKHGTEISRMIGVAYNLFLLCAIIHRVKIWRRNKRGEQWHSYNPGVSIFRIPRVSLETQSKWIDPAIIWTISVITYNLNDHTVTNWLQIGSLSLIIHEQVSYYPAKAGLAGYDRCPD